MPEQDEFGQEEEGWGADTEFNLDDDYKPEPLIKKGNYKGNVTGVALGDNASVQFTVVLNDNGGFMSDGETPIDGSEHILSHYLAREADKELKTRTGKNKWQTKVNMTKRFAESMQINMNTPPEIVQAVEDQEWVGIPVTVAIDNETFEGMTRPRIQSMKRREAAEE